MNTRTNWSRAAKAASLAVFAIAFAMVKPASAQNPIPSAQKADSSTIWTPAGTQIVNTATADYKDARGNTYTQETASATVTVGFRGQIAVSTAAGPIHFDAAATDQFVTFTVSNFGNGKDLPNFATGFAIPADTASLITNVRFCRADGTTCFASLALLSAAFASGDSIAAGGSMTIKVKFDVAAGTGGAVAQMSLTAKSNRDATDGDDTATSDIDVRYVAPDTNDPGTSVSVTAAVAAVSKLPTTEPLNPDSSAYVAQFTVTNNLTGPATYNLTTSLPNNTATITIEKIYLCSDVSKAAITSIYLTALTAGKSATICVSYTVPFSAVAGTTGDVTLTATHAVSATYTNNDKTVVTVIKPKLTLSKKAYLDNAGAIGTAITTETPKPGDYIWYEIKVTNDGSASAQTVVIDDPLPSQVIWVSTTDDAGTTPAWDYTGNSVSTDGHLVAKLSTMAANDVRWIRLRVQIK